MLTEKIEELGEELRTHFSIEEFSPASLPAQVCERVACPPLPLLARGLPWLLTVHLFLTPLNLSLCFSFSGCHPHAIHLSLPLQDKVTVLGQVCCDSNGKLNAHSVLLEAGPDQGGQQVPVDLSELREYSLFPGQVKYS